MSAAGGFSAATGAVPKRNETPVRYWERPEDVAGAIGKVIDKGGPLMKQAETRGFQTANRRGLLNSSMAANAAQDAVLNYATPIGQQQAQQDFTRNQSNRDFQQQANLADRSLNTEISISNANRAFEGEQKAKDRGLDWRISDANRAFEGEQKNLDRGLQERIANWNLDSEEAKQAAALLSDMERTFATQYQSILANTALSGEDRTKLLESVQTDRNNRVNLVEQLYNIDIKWGDDTQPPAGGGTTASAAPSLTPASLTPARVADLMNKAQNDQSKQVRDQAAKLLREAGITPPKPRISVVSDGGEGGGVASGSRGRDSTLGGGRGNTSDMDTGSGWY